MVENLAIIEKKEKKLARNKAPFFRRKLVAWKKVLEEEKQW